MPDYAGAGHLPQNRADNLPADPKDLPRQRRGITPQMIGRYPDYDVLEQAAHWDEATRRVVLARVHDVPPVRFFDADEADTARAFCAEVMAQDAEPRVPVMEMVDAKLFEGRLDGFRYADMPDDRETWRIVLCGLDAAAGGSFATSRHRHEIVAAFAAGELPIDIDASRAWSVVMRAVLAEYYSHPWAWNEIGFGGPAYPRGYMRLSGRDPHERPEEFDLDPVREG
jgi:Gluconate 2-dehydrogenase subunit 3